MKTLDEVIDAQERCTTYPNCHFCYLHSGSMCEWIRDALHYLKEYREKHDDILRMEEALGYCEIMENPPLTWDELRTMEGKPVWVEFYDDETNTWFYDKEDGGWMIIRDVCNGTKHYPFEYLNFGDTGGCVDKADLGKTWRAYRKERE